MSVDKEIKFIASANTQIKFYNRSHYHDVYRKVESLLMALGIAISQKNPAHERQSPTRRDTYFDADWFLANQKHSLTLRQYNMNDFRYKGNIIMTLKTNENSIKTNDIEILTRMEFDQLISQEDCDRFKKEGISGQLLRQYFPDANVGLDDNDLLRPNGDALIRRSLFTFPVDDNTYQINIDKFYYHSSDNAGRYSETFTEMEIETKSDDKTFGPGIRRVAAIMQCMFDIEPQPKSKYQRFKDFIGLDEFKEFYFLGFDLVAYSKDASWKQKQVVQRFHKILKDCVQTLPQPKQTVIISIGDGAIIAVPSDWSNVEKLVKKVHAVVQTNNAEDEMRKIEYRTAIHYGSVFLFTDLSDSMNVAGEGINTVSRILNEAQGGQVLVSAAAFQRIMQTTPNAAHFGEIGPRTVKHDVVLHLHEYTGCRGTGGSP